MVLLGTIVNAVAIVMGALIGTLFTKIPEKIKQTVTHGMALSVIILGLEMSFKSDQFLIVIGSLAIGGVLGEWWEIEKKLHHIGMFLERRIGVAGSTNNISRAFVTATLVFVVGAMSIVGALDSGLRGDHQVLYTKAMLDGFFSIIFSTTLGIGVLFSAIPVFIYQGSIAIFATVIESFVPQHLMDTLIHELTATGGVLIVAIGLNLLNLTKIKTGNLLPSILVCIILTAGLYIFQH